MCHMIKITYIHGSIFFFTQKTAYEMRISDWSSDVCSSDLATDGLGEAAQQWPGSRDALPFGPFEPEHHRTLDSGLRRWVQEQTGLDLGYVEQQIGIASGVDRLCHEV